MILGPSDPNPRSRNRVSACGVWAALLVSLCLPAGRGLAQPQDAEATTTGEATPKELAAYLTALAERLYVKEDFVGALARYREAYLSVSAPALLFNLAQCHRKLGQFAEAAVLFHVYLQVEPHTPYREMVEGLVAESRIQYSLATARSSTAPTELPLPPPVPERFDGTPPVEIDVPSPDPGPAPAQEQKDSKWSRKQRRWALALGGVALIAGSSAAIALSVRNNRQDDPAGTPSSASLGIIDWR